MPLKVFLPGRPEGALYREALNARVSLGPCPSLLWRFAGGGAGGLSPVLVASPAIPAEDFPRRAGTEIPWGAARAKGGCFD